MISFIIIFQDDKDDNDGPSLRNDLLNVEETMSDMRDLQNIKFNFFDWRTSYEAVFKVKIYKFFLSVNVVFHCEANVKNQYPTFRK